MTVQDRLFRVEVITQTPNPQQCVYAGMHQDYSEGFVYDSREAWPDEKRAGEICVKRLLGGERGHYGPLEHPAISFNCGWFPHSVMQQARTHRVGVSMDCQCLAGDTEITFLKSGSSKNNIKISDLYDLWTNGEKAVRERKIRGRKGESPGSYRRDCKKRLKKMSLRVLNEDSKEFQTSHIRNVMCSGVKPVYRLTMEDGKTLDCTTNHRLFTPEGWRTMEQAVSLKIKSDGSVASFRKTAQVYANGKISSGTGDYKDKVWLQGKVSSGLSRGEIAELAGCSKTTISCWIKRHGIDLPEKVSRPRSNDPAVLHRNEEWLKKQLNSGLSSKQMAEAANCSVEAIKKWVYHYGLSLNKQQSRFYRGMTPWNKGKTGYKLNLTEESRESRRAHGRKVTKRGPDSHFWKGGVSSDRMLSGAWTRQTAPQVHKKFNYTCQRCGEKAGKLHAHHLVPVYVDPGLAYNIDNLVTLCQPCHTYIHSNNLEAEFAANFTPIKPIETWQAKPPRKGRKLMAHPLTVVNVEYLGEQLTYDLEVEDPWHNFVANGLIVHNSMRYTGSRIVEASCGKIDLEEVFYLRPVGRYADRSGKKYEYTAEQRSRDLDLCRAAAERYRDLLEAGYAEEHARGILPFDYRQHFVVSFNLRSVLHFMDLRSKLDAQDEIRALCDHIWPHVRAWTPEISAWYEVNRMGRARLAP